MGREPRRCPVGVGLLFLLIATGISEGQVDPERPPTGESLAELSLEELMEVSVTSVSRRAQPLGRAPAAIHVITGEDLRRFAAINFAEALRGVPGLHVARASSNSWAISVRGFTDVYADKLQVLVDGRSVYTPLFSGTEWEVQDTFLEDLDRIEVIRGPGGTLWGANAVNGVINITTKSAFDTLGGLAQATIGTEEQGAGALRYGFRLDDSDWAMRIFAKGFHRDSLRTADDRSASDDWWGTRGGFRIDGRPSGDDQVTIQGEFYDQRGGYDRIPSSLGSDPDRPEPERLELVGGHLLARLQHQFSETSDLDLRVYYDAWSRTQFGANYDIHNFDIEATHRFVASESLEIIWGLGYRLSADRLRGNRAISTSPESRSLQVFSLFVQGELELVEDTLALTLGTKLEHNDFTGFEIQPSLRLSYAIDEEHTLWAAASRAVRTPSRVDSDARIDLSVSPTKLGVPLVTTYLGDDDFDSEVLYAYELGFRGELCDGLTLDAALFLHHYDGLGETALSDPFLVPGADPYLQLFIRNQALEEGNAFGAEFSLVWQASEDLRIAATYSYTRVRLDTAANATASVEDDSPVHQASLRLSYDVTDRFDVNVGAYYVDRIRGRDVPSYVKLDLFLRYRPSADVEIRAALENLLDDRHPEWNESPLVFTREPERSFTLSVLVSF